jgi:hypothetical protein
MRPNDRDRYAGVDQEKCADASDEPSDCPRPEHNSSQQRDGNGNENESAACDHAIIYRADRKLFSCNQAEQPQARQNH